MAKKIIKLGRDEFFGHPDVIKLTNKINKKSLQDFSYLYIRDKKFIKLLQCNIDWLDFVGISISYKNKILCVKWTRYN